MKKVITLWLVSFCLVLFSCHKKDIPDYSEGQNGGGDTAILSSDKQFLTFSLPDSLNADYLTKTVEGKIVGDSAIHLEIPKGKDISHLIAHFTFKGDTVLIENTPQVSGVTANDFTKEISYTVRAEDSSKKEYAVQVKRIAPQQSVLPHLFIDVDNGAAITSTDDYVHADIQIKGKKEFPDFEGRTKIRGRGNTSWGWPKKPYKLKLEEKSSLLGLPAYKKWILLANYNDRTLLMNAIPYKMGHLLGMPYTNHIIPVELTLNGKDQGLYIFTEHKEVGPDRIDIGKGKQAGVLLELDSYFDEPYEFKSKQFQLPVMVKYPELDEWDNQQDIDHRFNEIKDDFDAFEELVADPNFPNNNYLDYFNDTAFVNYLMIYMLTDNEEINHPKSTYINKRKGSQKYNMGIIWDFDWGFGFQSSSSHFEMATANNNLFWEKEEAGTEFFQKFLSDPKITSLFKKRWNTFKTDLYPRLKKHVKDYAEIIRPIYDKEHTIWGMNNAMNNKDSSGDLDTDLQKVLDWLDARVDHIDQVVSGW